MWLLILIFLISKYAIFYETDNVNWLDMYTCADSCANGLLENQFCDEINSFSVNSSNSFSSITHAPNPTLESKPLSDSLKYVFLSPNETHPVIIASNLTKDLDGKLLNVFRKNKEAIRCALGNVKGISPSIMQHRIHLEDNTKPYRDH